MRDLPVLLDELEQAAGPADQRAAQLLRRHGQTVCRRRDPACPDCVIASDCPSAGNPPPLY